MQLSGVCVRATASTPARPQTEEACSLNLTLLTAGQQQTRLRQKGERTALFQCVAPCGSAYRCKEVPVFLKYQVSTFIFKKCFFGPE